MAAAIAGTAEAHSRQVQGTAEAHSLFLMGRPQRGRASRPGGAETSLGPEVPGEPTMHAPAENAAAPVRPVVAADAGVASGARSCCGPRTMDRTAMAWMKKGTAAHPPRLRLPRMLGSNDATTRSPTPHTPSPSWFWDRLFTLVTKVWRYNPKKIATHVVTLVLFCSGWFETPHNGARWTHLCACGFIPHGKI